jgi:hypothetical protein
MPLARTRSRAPRAAPADRRRHLRETRCDTINARELRAARFAVGRFRRPRPRRAIQSTKLQLGAFVIACESTSVPGANGANAGAVAVVRGAEARVRAPSAARHCVARGQASPREILTVSGGEACVMNRRAGAQVPSDGSTDEGSESNSGSSQIASRPQHRAPRTHAARRARRRRWRWKRVQAGKSRGGTACRAC